VLLLFPVQLLGQFFEHHQNEQIASQMPPFAHRITGVVVGQDFLERHLHESVDRIGHFEKALMKK